MPKYKIPELKIEIEAKDQQDFERKKQIILNRNNQYTTGGHKANNQRILIKEF